MITLYFILAKQPGISPEKSYDCHPSNKVIEGRLLMAKRMRTAPVYYTGDNAAAVMTPKVV